MLSLELGGKTGVWLPVAPQSPAITETLLGSPPKPGSSWRSLWSLYVKHGFPNGVLGGKVHDEALKTMKGCAWGGMVLLGHTHVRAVDVDAQKGLVAPPFLGFVGVRWENAGQVWTLEASSALLPTCFSGLCPIHL